MVRILRCCYYYRELIDLKFIFRYGGLNFSDFFIYVGVIDVIFVYVYVVIVGDGFLVNRDFGNNVLL